MLTGNKFLMDMRAMCVAEDQLRVIIGKSQP